jgi:hypothetical protein
MAVKVIDRPDSELCQYWLHPTLTDPWMFQRMLQPLRKPACMVSPSIGQLIDQAAADIRKTGRKFRLNRKVSGKIYLQKIPFTQLSLRAILVLAVDLSIPVILARCFECRATIMGAHSNGIL